MKTTRLDEAIGWYGCLAIIAAYALVSFQYVLPESFTYQVLNLTGSTGLFWIAHKKEVHQTEVINIIWGTIAIIAIINLL